MRRMWSAGAVPQTWPAGGAEEVQLLPSPPAREAGGASIEAAQPVGLCPEPWQTNACLYRGVTHTSQNSLI